MPKIKNSKQGLSMRNLVLLLSLFISANAFSSINYIHQFFPLESGEQGIPMAIARNMTIPAGQKSITLYQGHEDDVPYRWKLVFRKTSNQMRELKLYSRFMMLDAKATTGNCNKNSAITHRTVKYYVDHELIDYIEYNSGVLRMSERRCVFRHDVTSDLGSRFQELGIGVLGFPSR